SGSPYSVTVTAAVGVVTANAYFTWTVSKVTVTNPGDQSNAVGDAVSLQITARDNDGGPLTYSATGLPSGLSINSSSGLISGTIATRADAGSPYSVTVTATHLTHSASQTFIWAVSHVFVVNPGDQFYAPNDTVSLQITARDNDGGPLTYSATGLPSALSIN